MNIRHILVATDFSEASEGPLRVAARFAAAFDARITVVHVFDPNPLSPAIKYPMQVWSGADLVSQLARESDRLLDDVIARLFSGQSNVVALGVSHPSAATAICDAASEREADLIIVGTHGRGGVSRLLLGSVAEKVIRHAEVPVLLVRPDANPDVFPERILVTTDFSQAALPALSEAAALAERFDASVTLAHVYEQPSRFLAAHQAYPGFEDVAPSLRDTLQEMATARIREGAEARLLSGASAVPALVEEIERGHFDLLVIAKRGRTGLSRMLVGSVAEGAARRAPSSVWVGRCQ